MKKRRNNNQEKNMISDSKINVKTKKQIKTTHNETRGWRLKLLKLLFFQASCPQNDKQIPGSRFIYTVHPKG